MQLFYQIPLIQIATFYLLDLTYHHHLFHFILLFGLGSCKSTSIPTVNFKLSLEFMYFSTLLNKFVISFSCFLERDNCSDPSFYPLIKDHIVSVIGKSVISNASKLKHEIYFCKDSLRRCVIPERLMVIFFGFLLLTKFAMNYYVNSAK